MITKIFLICFIIFISGNGLPLDNSTITIAVVEYQPSNNSSLTREEIVEENTAKYIELLHSIENSGVNLIIYPEDTLRSNRITAVEINFDNPCDSNNYPKYMKDLSCAARETNTYIIVNLVEKSKCFDDKNSENCRNYGFYFYNTDVIFDNDGKIVNRYRKFNLFGENDRDKPSIAEKITFETNFGLKFGIFTCFDILFKSPAQDLVDDKIEHIIFPTMWFSELPFLTALQTQQMWAQEHKVKLYASGANNPRVGSGGTGVYDGGYLVQAGPQLTPQRKCASGNSNGDAKNAEKRSKGTILSDIIAKGGSKVYLYKYNENSVMVTEDTDAVAKEMDDFYLKTDLSVEGHKSAVLTETSSKTKLCDGDFCCNFDIKFSINNSISQTNSYTYLMVAYSGIRSYSGVYNGGIELCGIIACLNTSLSSCGRRFPNYDDVNWPLTFENITINAVFEDNENKTQFPNSLLSSIRPIKASDTVWTTRKINGENMIERNFSTIKPQNRLLTFSIFGRDFGRDSPPERLVHQQGIDNNSAISTKFNLFLLILLLFSFKF